MKITLLTLMALQYLNAPYRWGENGPWEYDCSGLTIKVLHDCGITLPDMTAQSIHDWHEKKAKQACEPGYDCLLYFGTSTGQIKHVAIGIGGGYMIEAGGAGRNSLGMNVKDLGRIDARVRIKPITNRGDLVAAYKLEYPGANCAGREKESI